MSHDELFYARKEAERYLKFLQGRLEEVLRDVEDGVNLRRSESSLTALSQDFGRAMLALGALQQMYLLKMNGEKK